MCPHPGVGVTGGAVVADGAGALVVIEGLDGAGKRTLAEGLRPAYARSLGEAADPNANGYRLPSEDEWEYAARAGSRDALPSGPLPNCDSASWKLSHVAWFRANSGRRPHAVAKRRPNRWRLYDIAGNVAEWTHERAVRGGSWGSPARDVRYSARSEHAGTYASPRIGLRVVRSL